MIRLFVVVATIAASVSPLAAYAVTAIEATQAVMIIERHKAELASNPNGNGTVATAKAEVAPADDGCFATCIAEGNADPSPAIRNLPASEKAEFCADYCEGQQS